MAELEAPTRDIFDEMDDELLAVWIADNVLSKNENARRIINGLRSITKLKSELAALTARLEAAERGANRYKILHNGDLPGYAILPCDDESRHLSLDGDILDVAIGIALKERK